MHLFFCKEFNKFNNTQARISDSIKISLKSHFCRKRYKICHYVQIVVMDVLTFPVNL